MFLKAAQAASKSLMEAVCEIYEPQWTGYEALQAQVSASESLWQDFSHKLADQVLIPLNTYTGQFPEMKVFLSQCFLLMPFKILNNFLFIFFLEKSRQT